MWKWIQAFASPKNFYQISAKMIPWFLYPFIIITLVGLYWGLVIAPADYQQGESYRIMYVHVPSAWMSMFIYLVMAISGGIGLIWQIKLASVVAKVSAPIGASFTFLALVTGAVWGKPMWGLGGFGMHDLLLNLFCCSYTWLICHLIMPLIIQKLQQKPAQSWPLLD